MAVEITVNFGEAAQRIICVADTEELLHMHSCREGSRIMKKAALYIRVSTDEQAKEGYSIPAQRERLTAYVTSQGWEIADYYIDEGVSAKNTNRPELQRMLNDIHCGLIDVVLVYRLDRLTRSVLDLYNLLQEFDRYNVTFKSATEVYDTTTAIGRLFITLVAALAQWERENLGERTKFGKVEKARQGKRPGGKAPFGYDKVNGELVVNEKEAETVRMIFRLYAKHANLNKVTEELYRQGCRTKNNAIFSVNTVQKILKNPIYIGTLRYNYTTQTGTITTVKPEEDWIIVEDALPPIIDKEEFYFVQKILDAQAMKKPRSVASGYLFSGLVTCPNCGSTLNGTTYHSKGKKTPGQPIRYFRCSFTKPGACHHFQIREDKLERLFLAELRNRTDQIRREVTGDKNACLKAANLDDYKRELESLKQKRKRLQQLFITDLIEMDELREQLEAFNTRQAELEQLIQTESEQLENRFSNEQLLSLYENLQQSWEELSFEEKKQFVSILVKSITAQRHPKEPRGYVLESLVFHG
jgi:site-specific DNA recombinase